jgi:hypothetical protein
MSDWSKHTAKRFLENEEATKRKAEKDREAEITQNKKFVREQEILESRAPELWSGLCQQAETACKDFNSDVGRPLVTCQKIVLNTLEMIRSDTGMKTSLVFESKTYSIKIRSLAADSVGEVEKLDIKIQAGTDEPRFFDSQSRLVDPVAVAQLLLERLIS